MHRIIGYCYTLSSYAFYTLVLFDALYAVIHIFVVLLSITCIYSNTAHLCLIGYCSLDGLEKVKRPMCSLPKQKVIAGHIVREFYQTFGKSGNKFPTKKFLHQYVC